MEIDNNNILISKNVLKSLSEIDSFNDEWTSFKKKLKHKYNDYIQSAILNSVGSAARLNGAVMTDLEIEVFLAGVDTKINLSNEQHFLINYNHCVNEINQTYQESKLSESYIIYLYQLLFNTNDTLFKKENFNSVDRAYNNEIRKKIEKLILWFDSTKNIHTLLKIGVFILKFLEIYPYKQKTDVIAFLLIRFMVLKASYEYISLFSFEKFIEHNKLKYRKVLFKSLESLKTSNPDYSSWLDFFFLSIKKSLQHSKKIELLMHTFFTQNQLTIIEYSDKVNSFSLNDLEQALNIDKNKLTISLEKLVKLKIIKKEYLGTYYIYQKKY